MRKKKKYKRKIATHRTYPLPKWFNNTPNGTCRWCNKSIYNDLGVINTRRRWHQECLHEYFMVTRSSYAKRFVKKRDRGVCAKCGKFCRYRGEWQADHIIPLADRPDNNIKWWSLENLSTKCVDCHKKKTIQENADRRKQKVKKGRKVD